MTTARDTIIRRLAPFLQNGVKMNLLDTYMVLAKLSPDERATLLKVMACCRLTIAKNKRKSRLWIAEL